MNSFGNEQLKEVLDDEKKLHDAVDELLDKIANSIGGKVVKDSSKEGQNNSFSGIIRLAEYTSPHDLLKIKLKGYIGCGNYPTIEECIEEWESVNKKKWWE